jgi:hypothetical protein
MSRKKPKLRLHYRPVDGWTEHPWTVELLPESSNYGQVRSTGLFSFSKDALTRARNLWFPAGVLPASR